MTLARILTAGVLIPLVVAAVVYGPTWLIVLIVGAVILLALHEFFALAARAGVPGFSVFTIFCVGLSLADIALGEWRLTYGHLGESLTVEMIPIPFIVAVVFIFGIAILAVRGNGSLAQSFSAVGTSSAALLFVALPLTSLIPLHNASRGTTPLLLFLLCVIWAGDTAAYCVGRAIGRHPMAPQLSPQKTWEGAAGNLAGSLLAGAAFARWSLLSATDLLIAAALANLAGQLGDLMESAYKRAAGVKDSGSLLPGHGGILDRIDSLIFAAPVVWYYFSVILMRRL
jgi:phosphatidate cytidylyltransferase